MKNDLPSDYPDLPADIRERIRKAQVKANLAVNREMIALYWEISRLITERQKNEGWGAGVIPHLTQDIKNELPEALKSALPTIEEVEADLGGKEILDEK